MRKNFQKRFDIYRLIHKYLRSQIGRTLLILGNTNFSKKNSRTSFIINFKKISNFLRDHAHREEEFIHPLLLKKNSKSITIVEKDHKKLESQLNSIEKNLGQAKSNDEFHHIYLELSDFSGNYFKHLYDEETKLLPELHKHYTDEKLGQVSRELLKGIPQDIATEVTKEMMVVINVDERIGLLETMRENMPPEAYHSFFELTKSVLTPKQINEINDGMKKKVSNENGLFNQSKPRPNNHNTSSPPPKNGP